MQQTIAVIGATGKIGQHVVRQLLANEHRVQALARTPDNLRIDHPRLTKTRVDVLDLASLTQALEGVSHVLSCLGRGTRKGDGLMIVGEGTRNIITAMAANDITRLCLISAIGVGDDFPWYRRTGRAFQGGHEVVHHRVREYVRNGTDVHSNTIEGVFSLLKRGVMGTFHSVSRKHLPNYLNEFEFRHNTRKLNDGQRVTRAIRQVDGKRLTYRESVDNPPCLVVPQQPQAPFEG